MHLFTHNLFSYPGILSSQRPLQWETRSTMTTAPFEGRRDESDICHQGGGAGGFSPASRRG